MHSARILARTDFVAAFGESTNAEPTISAKANRMIRMPFLLSGDRAAPCGFGRSMGPPHTFTPRKRRLLLMHKLQGSSGVWTRWAPSVSWPAVRSKSFDEPGLPRYFKLYTQPEDKHQERTRMNIRYVVSLAIVAAMVTITTPVSAQS